MLRELVRGGADVDLPSHNRLSPLHVARDATTVELLLAAGADPSRRDQFGRSPYAYHAQLRLSGKPHGLAGFPPELAARAAKVSRAESTSRLHRGLPAVEGAAAEDIVEADSEAEAEGRGGGAGGELPGVHDDLVVQLTSAEQRERDAQTAADATADAVQQAADMYARGCGHAYFGKMREASRDWLS